MGPLQQDPEPWEQENASPPDRSLWDVILAVLFGVVVWAIALFVL